MEVRRFFTEGLAHASYLVVCLRKMVAAVIDPDRDIAPYVEEADRLGARIETVLLTHLHADFVAGHMDLHDQEGATIAVAAAAEAQFPHRALADGDEIKVGSLTLRALATPGHSPESMCFAASEAGARPTHLFTGDTLFVGDVGRPDLWGSDVARSLAQSLYDSITGKLFPLGDSVTVAPAHGAGSLCGKNLSAEPFSTLGRERTGNCAIAGKDRAAFVRELLEGMPEAPPQFARNARTNRQGPTPVARLAMPRAMSAADVATATAAGAWVVDVRDKEAFKAGHVPGCQFLGAEASSHTWASWLLPADRPLILLTGSGGLHQNLMEARRKLLRVGFDDVRGYLEGGIDAWRAAGRPVATLTDLAARDLHAQRAAGGPELVDVRQPVEYAAGHPPGARHIPLGLLPRHAAELRDRPLAIMCAGGYRSVIGASALMRAGITRLVNVPGGFRAWSQAGLSIEQGERKAVAQP